MQRDELPNWRTKERGCYCTDSKAEKRSEVRKNACRLCVWCWAAEAGVVRDPSQVFEIVLGWTGAGACTEEVRKGGLGIYRFPLFSSKEDSKMSCAFATLGSHGPEGHMPFLGPQYHSLMEKGQVYFQLQNLPTSSQPQGA